MTSELSIFATRLREQISLWAEDFSLAAAANDPAWLQHADIEFSGFAVMLFTLQCKHNAAYRRLCEARGIRPGDVSHWRQIPAVPTAAFKEMELTSLHPEDRARVFHSSGTTAQRPSRHFHNADSLALYEASLWSWFVENCGKPGSDCHLISLTPPAAQAPHSSLVHMFDCISRNCGPDQTPFLGQVGPAGEWNLDLETALRAFSSGRDARPRFVLGTAFSFVHLLDGLAARGLSLQLPAGSKVLETGGYKGRSRSLPKAELHRLIGEKLGVSSANIICEYGMSELGSQAYDAKPSPFAAISASAPRVFRFPPWTRARVISPETGQEVAEGEAGLLQVFDLANAFSVLALQTEDLVLRRGDGFELVGRAPQAEPRGCSLMTP